MSVSRKAKALYNKIFEGSETMVANAILAFQERRALKKYVRGMPHLTPEQKKAVKAFWEPYYDIDTDWVRYYTAITGRFDPRYIPTDLQHTKIDQFFNQRKLGYGFNDKNYYSLIFPTIKQPKTVVRKIGGLLFNEDYLQIDLKQAEALLSMREEVIVKPSQESGGGRYIQFFDTHSDAEALKKSLLDPTENNLIIQDIVHQHHELGKMHPSSLNTIRIYTIMLEDGVHILSSSFRMGANDSRIDNVTASAGIIVGIKPIQDALVPGEIMDCAYFDMYSGKATDRHPQGMPLSEIQVPMFPQMIETAKRAAQYTGNFQLVGWDFSVDESGEIVLIEANMRKGGIGPIQCMHGPFFGELTKIVLDKVFGKI